ncbi:MAG: SseB family protein [Clostridiales bacterium]|jgi:hypothetical protein|nr:SseB family protein [Clostridiales bacterium]
MRKRCATGFSPKAFATGFSPQALREKEGETLGSIFDEEFDPFLDWNGAYDKYVASDSQNIKLMLRKMLKADFYYPVDPADETKVRFLASNEMVFLPIFTSMSELCQFEAPHKRKIAKLKDAREILRVIQGPCGIVVNPFGKAIAFGSQQLFGSEWEEIANEEDE